MKDQTKKPPVQARKEHHVDEEVEEIENDDDQETNSYEEESSGSESQQENEDDENNDADKMDQENSSHLSVQFNKLLINLINIYDKYAQTCQPISDSMDRTSPSHSSIPANLDECLSKLERLNLNELSKTDLLSYLLELLDRLTELIYHSKRESFQELFAFFKSTNLVVIQFYEFVNRMLNVFNESAAAVNRSLDIMASNRFHSMSSASKSNFTREAKTAVIGKALELLHVLIINKNGDQDEYAASASFCGLVATSFNFTSSISRLLVMNNKSRGDHDSIGDKNAKIAYSILNELTSNNKLLLVDNHVKQLVYEILDRILKNSFQPMQLQLLSNTLRNDTVDIENIIKSTSKVRELYRQLISIILNKQIADVVLNSLIILIKLKYDSMFSILWPVSSSSSSSSSSRSTTGGASQQMMRPMTVTNMFEPFDLTLQVLDDNSLLFSSKLNAINFLLEFVKFDQVKNLLEINDSYSSLFLFKLKLFLIDKSYETLPNIFIIKILGIFNQLATASEKLCRKLFFIVFNTRKFIDSGSDDNTSKKLKGILIANNRNAKSNKAATNNSAKHFDVFIDFFTRLAEIHIQSEPKALSAPQKPLRIKNPHLSACFLQYLLNLLKKNEKKFECLKDCEESLRRINKTLVDNLTSFQSMLMQHSSGQQQQQQYASEYDDGENLTDELYFYNLAIIDSIYALFKLNIDVNEDRHHQETIIKRLFALLENKTWLNTSEKSITSGGTRDGELSLFNYKYIFITIKLLIRLCFEGSDELENQRQKLLVYVKSHHFMEVLCLLMIKSNEFIYQLMAYDLIFQLRDIYDFPIETFIKTSLKLKETLEGGYSTNSSSRQTIFEAETRYQSFVTPDSEFAAAATAAAQQKSGKDLASYSYLVSSYERRIAQQNEQETHVMNILNQYFAKSQLKEAENREMRAQLNMFAHKSIEFNRELEASERRRAELDSKLVALSKLHAEMEKSYEDLKSQNAAQTKETAKMGDQYRKLKDECEQMKRDNDESIRDLKRQFEIEKSEKGKLEEKIVAMESRLREFEEEKADKDARIVELEDELKQKETLLNEKSSQLTQKSTELENVKNDVQKLKSILSYVKNADI